MEEESKRAIEAEQTLGDLDRHLESSMTTDDSKKGIVTDSEEVYFSPSTSPYAVFLSLTYFLPHSQPASCPQTVFFAKAQRS